MKAFLLTLLVSVVAFANPWKILRVIEEEGIYTRVILKSVTNDGKTQTVYLLSNNYVTDSKIFPNVKMREALDKIQSDNSIITVNTVNSTLYPELKNNIIQSIQVVQ